MIEGILTLSLIATAIIAWWVIYKLHRIKLLCRELKDELAMEKENYKKLLSQKKSSEVVTGQIAEKFVPFLKSFKHNPRQTQFLGMPIDLVVFGDEAVTFIEVKSGNARLNKNQQRIKKLILDKKVKWEEIRIK